jgi:PncC family amidohydrolase
MIAAAESCTAGLAADFIVRVPGASKVFWGSFVVYTQDAKIKMLGMPASLLEEYGAVSRPVALAMAEEALKKSGASWAFSVTGLAGPGGDEPEGNLIGVPIGTIWI